jgi:hypothetical protein
VGRLGILVTLRSGYELHYSLTQKLSQFDTEGASSGVCLFFPFICDEMRGMKLM